MGKWGPWLVPDVGHAKEQRAGEDACYEPPRTHGKRSPQSTQPPLSQGNDLGQAPRKARDNEQGSAEDHQ